MKYSQAVIVACIGSAALVSALPAAPVPPKNAVSTSAAASGSAVPTPKIPGAQNKQAKPTASASVSAPAAKATTINSKVQAKPAKPHAKDAHKEAHKEAKNVKAAGHKSAKPHGNVAAAEHNKKAGAKPTKAGGEHLKAATVSAAHPTQSGAALKDAKKAPAGAKPSSSAAVPSSTAAKATGAVNAKVATPKPTAAAAHKRDFEEELEARLFDNLRAKYREAKANRLQKNADKAKAEADKAQAQLGTPAQARDFFEDYEEFEERDFEEDGEDLEELFVRDFEEDDEVYGRGIGDMFRAVFHKSTPQEKADRLKHIANQKQAEADKAAGKAGITAPPAAREFWDDEDVEERDFDDFEYDFDARDFYEIDELD